MNLAANSCAAMPEGGEIHIATSQVGGRVQIQVSDTGCGIPGDVIDKIFDPFFSTKPVGKGTGLGLSVSLGIVQQHGGIMEVESEPDKGTCFTIVLPAIQEPSHV